MNKDKLIADLRRRLKNCAEQNLRLINVIKELEEKYKRK